MTEVSWCILALAVGTYAMRSAGPLLAAGEETSRRTRSALDLLAVALFSALIATATLIEGDGWTGAARPAGVLVATLLVGLRAPFVAVVGGAALTTALLRSIGVT